MPGTDFTEALKVVCDQTPELIALPELPARGLHAAMIGRGLAVASELPVSLDAHGWRLADSPDKAARRARSLLGEDLDRAEELMDGESLPLKIQVAGPWTLAASLQTPRGEKVVGDPGARRDLIAALAHGMGEYVAEVRRRLAPSELVVQLDEPSLPAVAAGGIPTGSGLHRYRTIDVPELSAGLSTVIDGHGVAIAHCCAPGVPVALLAGAGFAAINFDLSLTAASDAWGEAFDTGIDLWPGEILSGDAIAGFFGRLGFELDAVHDRLVVTPPCGLADSTPAEAARALDRAQRLARG